MKKIIIFIFVLSLFSNLSNSQSSYIKQINKGKYSKVEKKLEKSLQKSPNDIELNYAKSYLYNSKKFNKYNSEKAYDYIIKANSNFYYLKDEKARKKLEKILINTSSITKQIDSVSYNALTDISKNNSIEDYNKFLTYFKLAPQKYKNQAIENRDNLAYDEALEINTIASYQYFMDNYPISRHFKFAEKNRNKLAFQIASSENTIESYNYFMKTYPYAKEFTEAETNRDELAFNKAKSIDNSSAYENFINNYPNSKQKNEAFQLFETRLFEEITTQNNGDSYISFIENFPNNSFINDAIDSLYLIGSQIKYLPYIKYGLSKSKGNQYTNGIIHYYNLISKDGELSSLKMFSDKFFDYLYLIDTYEDDLEKALFAESIGLTGDLSASHFDNSDELNQRLIREGAKSGSIQISLMWDNYNDLDLHCIDPFGEEIYYGHRKSYSGGELDVDMNVSPESLRPVENIYWQEGNAPIGQYTVILRHYSNHRCGVNCKDPTKYKIRIKIGNKIKEYTGSISHPQKYRTICTFNYTGTEYGEIELTQENIQKLKNYILESAPNDLSFVALQILISQNIKNKRWSIALATLKEFENSFKNNSKYNDLVLILKSQLDNSIKINPIYSINSVNGEEYSPVISADNKIIYFCGKERNDNIGGEDIFYSKLIGYNWSKPELDRGLSYRDSNEAPMALSSDGNTIIQFRNGKIGYCDKTEYGWTELEYFPDNINKGSWTGDAMLTSDGNALIFASERPGSFNFTAIGLQGYHASNNYASDIYISLREDDTWGEPINIGPSINTIYSERSPFLHPDMKTLYFSSDGHGGLGKYDVFKSTRLSDTCWNCWTEPINLGKEINTEENDWGYTISTDGSKAYFAKYNDKKKNKIYWLNLPTHLRPDMVATVSGKLLDSEKKAVSADIKWEDLSTGKNIGQSKSDPVDGSFFIVLPLGKIYGYYVDGNDYFPVSKNIDLRNSKDPVVLEENIDIISFKQMIEEEIAVPINNLFFNFAQSSLLEYSLPELRRVAKIIKKNNLSVEISGHTDNIGNDADNQILSEKRADAVKEFLINENCEADKLHTIGYGATKPVATNDTEAGRAKNRRVELKFIQ